jgi:acetoin utilization deacetylase AcuC-like enzyme
VTILYTDELFLRHETARHPECPARLVAIMSRLDRPGLLDRCKRGTFAPLTPEEVALVHAPNVAADARRLCEKGGGLLEADTVCSPASYQVALAAAGACASAVDAVLDGVDRTALCLVRPPGHHATPTRSMGFCLFNNIALAARRALDRGLSRVLIVDWDVHHGNGTQDIFYEDPRVTFLSVHRFGHGFYPGTGDADETGTGDGLGATINVPLRFGTRREDYHAAFRSALEKTADRYKPELVLVSAGFDAHALDPIGSLGLDVEDFATLTRAVLNVAETHSAGRLVSCLEGGYHWGALAESVQAHLETLLASKGTP